MEKYTPLESCDFCECECLSMELYYWGGQWICDRCLSNLDRIEEMARIQQKEDRMKGGRDG